MLLNNALQPVTDDLRHMRLLTAQVLIIQVCSSIEEINCLRIIVQVFMLHTQVVQSNDHGGIDVFLISSELEFITDRMWLIEEIRTAIA